MPGLMSAQQGMTGSLTSAMGIGQAFPEINYNFIVFTGLDFFGDFGAVTGIEYSNDPFEWKEGGRLHSPHYFPFNGPIKAGRLRLTTGWIIASALRQWMSDVEMGRESRRAVWIAKLARDGWPSVIMRFSGCLPVKWSCTDLNSLDVSSERVSTESLEIVYEQYSSITVSTIFNGLRTAGVI